MCGFCCCTHTGVNYVKKEPDRYHAEKKLDSKFR